MADSSFSRLPPHLEGKLLVQTSNSKKWTERYCVVLENTFHCYKNEGTYKKSYHKTMLSVSLEKVVEITETLHHGLPKTYDANCVFKLRTEQKEIYLVAKNRQQIEWWVDGLRRIKAFWNQHRRRNESLNEEEQLEMGIECSENASDEEGNLSLTLVTIDGNRNKFLVEENFVVEDLFFKLTDHGDREGSPCEMCQLRKTGVQFWAVNSEGAGHKLAGSCPLLEVRKDYSEVFMLENHHKLLIVHFEDGTILVSPENFSITTREVLNIPALREKLAALDCDNPGLFFVTSTDTEMPFRPEEKPLEMFMGPSSYNRGKLVMKSKALGASPTNPGREQWMGMAEKIRIENMFQDRNNRHIEEQINRHNIGRKRREEYRKKKETEIGDKFEDYNGHNFVEGEAVPIKSKKAQWDKLSPLEFYEDHFTYPDTVVETCVGDFVKIDYQNEFNKKQDDKNLTQNQNTNSDCRHICSTGRFENENNVSSVMQEYDEIDENCEERNLKEETHNVLLFPLSKSNAEESKLCSASLNPDPFHSREGAVGKDNENLTQVVEQIQIKMSKTFNQENSIVFKNEKNIENNTSVCVKKGICEMIPSSLLVESDTLGNYLEKTSQDERNNTNHNACPTKEGVETAVETETNEENQSSNVFERNKIGGSSYDCAQDVEEHYCDFYKVRTPNILRTVLKSQVDEYVTKDNKIARICLSGSHFVYRNGKWHFQGCLEEIKESVIDSSMKSFRLDFDLVITYNESVRRWIVSKKRDDFEVQTCVKDRHSLVSELIAAEQQSTTIIKEDKTSTADFNENDIEKNVCLKNEESQERKTKAPLGLIKPVLDSTDYSSAFCDVNQNSSDFSFMQTRNITNDRLNFDLTTGITSEPLGEKDVEKVKSFNVNNFVDSDNDDASFSRTESLRSKLLISSFSSDKAEASTSEIRPDLEYSLSTTKKSLDVLQDVYKQITRHMSALNPEDALNDTRCRAVGELIYEQLIPTLWLIIKRGLRKTKFWHSRITPWTVVTSTECANSNVVQFIRVANCLSLTDEGKFKFFVCKCLNYGQGTLETWFALYYYQLKKADSPVSKCYEEGDIDTVRLRVTALEDVVSEVSRLSYLPFRLCFPRKIQEFGLKHTS